MNLKTAVKTVFTRSCIFFTLAILAIFVLANAIDQTKLLSLTAVFQLYAFTLALSASFAIFRAKKLSGPAKGVLHFLVCTAVFALIVVIGGNLKSPTTVLVGVCLFMVAYLIVAIVSLIVRRLLARKKDDAVPYKSQFKKS